MKEEKNERKEGFEEWLKGVRKINSICELGNAESCDSNDFQTLK